MLKRIDLGRSCFATVLGGRDRRTLFMLTADWHGTEGVEDVILYGADEAVEEYYCNYGLSPRYGSLIERTGLRVTGVDDDGEVRIVELDDDAFFLATVFCFQTRSRPCEPHRLVAGFTASA